MGVLNEKRCKNRKKKSGNFSKMDIFKMSKNKNLQQMFVKNSIPLVYAVDSDSYLLY